MAGKRQKGSSTSSFRPEPTPSLNPNEGKKLSAREEKEFGRLAEKMELFHNHFKHSFNEIFTLADGSFAKKGYSLPLFLRMCGEFSQGLEFHHQIEERMMFPILSKKMGNEFGNRHPDSHHRIHQGLDQYDLLLSKYRADPKEYNPVEFRACLSSFKDVLFMHLDEEVEDLGAANMKKYWTLDEIRRLPI